MSTEQENREAVAKRVEEQRKKMALERKKMLGTAPKITEQLLGGIDASEDIVVKLKDGSYGVLTIFPLSEEQLITIFAEFGTEKISKLGSGQSLGLEDYDFFWKILAASTGFKQKLLSGSLAMGESSIAAQRVLEISGAMGDVESFHGKD